jgi:hypothetical protein
MLRHACGDARMRGSKLPLGACSDTHMGDGGDLEWAGEGGRPARHGARTRTARRYSTGDETLANGLCSPRPDRGAPRRPEQGGGGVQGGQRSSGVASAAAERTEGSQPLAQIRSATASVCHVASAAEALCARCKEPPTEARPVQRESRPVQRDARPSRSSAGTVVSASTAETAGIAQYSARRAQYSASTAETAGIANSTTGTANSTC